MGKNRENGIDIIVCRRDRVGRIGGRERDGRREGGRREGGREGVGREGVREGVSNLMFKFHLVYIL